MHRTKATSDEGAVSEADWGRDKVLCCNIFLSLRLRLQRIHLPHQREAGRSRASAINFNLLPHRI